MAGSVPVIDSRKKAQTSYQSEGNSGWFSPGFWMDVANDYGFSPWYRSRPGNAAVNYVPKMPQVNPAVRTAGKAVMNTTLPPAVSVPANVAITAANKFIPYHKHITSLKAMDADKLLDASVPLFQKYSLNPRSLSDMEMLNLAEIHRRGQDDTKFAEQWQNRIQKVPGAVGDENFGKLLQKGTHLGEARDKINPIFAQGLKLYGYDATKAEDWHNRVSGAAFKQGMQDNYWNWAWKPMQQNGISGFGDSLSRIGMGIDAYGKANNMPWLNKYTVGGGLALGTLGLGALALSGGSNDQPQQQPQYPGYPNPQQNMYMNFYGGPNAFSYGTNYSRRTF